MEYNSGGNSRGSRKTIREVATLGTREPSWAERCGRLRSSHPGPGTRLDMDGLCEEDEKAPELGISGVLLGYVEYRWRYSFTHCHGFKIVVWSGEQVGEQGSSAGLTRGYCLGGKIGVGPP